MNMRSVIFKAVVFLFLSHNASGKNYDWLLIYYMPYDNNLSPLSQNIIHQIAKDGRSNNICVTLQVDRAGNGGMSRYSFNSKVDSMNIDEEESASSKVFDAYLGWVSKNFKAKHYSIILLNHGGELNEYGLDEYPRTQWLQIDSLAISIQKFNLLEGISKIDLLFEQVCSRGTIENLYEFRDVAMFTLASQDLVPAPGYYYSKVFSDIKTGKINSGDKLADLIVNNERDDMYYSFTLVENSKWKDWQKLLEMHSLSLNDPNTKINQDNFKIVSYGGVTYFDFISLINSVSTPSQDGLIKDFTNQVLIKRLYVNKNSERMMGYSGLSVCSPFKIPHSALSIYSLRAYQNFLSSLGSLARKE